MWIRFKEKWDHIDTRFTICYEAGMESNVPHNIAEKAISLGKAEAIKPKSRRKAVVNEVEKQG